MISDSHEVIDKPRIGKPENVKKEISDLSLRKKNSDYKRKNAFLWCLAACTMVAMVAITGFFVWSLFTDENLRKTVVKQITDNVVTISTIAFTLYKIPFSGKI